MQEAGKIIHLIPEYFPRVSTMMRLVGVSECVLHPEVQYSRQSWQNRTKIRNPDGWQWLTVPLEARHLGDAIADTAIFASKRVGNSSSERPKVQLLHVPVPSALHR